MERENQEPVSICDQASFFVKNTILLPEESNIKKQQHAHVSFADNYLHTHWVIVV